MHNQILLPHYFNYLLCIILKIKLLRQLVINADNSYINQNKIIVELPKNPEHGCLAPNAALVLSKEFKPPINLATKLQELFYLKSNQMINFGKK